MHLEKKTSASFLVAALVLFVTSFYSMVVQATPAFARQMGVNCMACHNQSVPMLNAFGRTFKASGYTMVGGDKSMIEGGSLGFGLPLAINAGVGIKAQYLSSDAVNKRDVLSIPSGSSIMVGGRIGENAGVHTLWNGDGLVHTQIHFSRPMSGGDRFGVALAGSLGHGAFIATEGYNTGLHKELQIFDNSALSNAAQASGIGLAKGPTTTVTAYYNGNGLSLSGGARVLGYNSTFTNGGLDIDGSLGYVFRVAYDLPAMGGWNGTIGAYGVGGTTTGTTSKLLENTNSPLLNAPWANGVNDHDVDSNGLDMQFQGQLAGLDTQVILNHVASYELKISNPVNGMTMVDMDTSATSLQAQTMLNSAWGVRYGAMQFENNKNSMADYDTYTLGLNYNYADNIRFSAEYTNVSPDMGDSYYEALLTTIIGF